MSKPPKTEENQDLEHDPPPPVFGTWGRFYAVVVANTVFVYLLLLLFSRFAR
jgi:hypothetical protein